MTITVYRVEDSMGGGPYRGDRYNHRAIRTMGDAHCDDDHPTPWGDPLLRDVPNVTWLFGFKDPSDLAVWFAGWLAGLDEAGFYVSTYDVHPAAMAHGTRQVMFDPEDREPAERLPVLTFIAKTWS